MRNLKVSVPNFLGFRVPKEESSNISVIICEYEYCQYWYY